MKLISLFLEVQRYNPEKTIVYQDNKSTISLAKNGKFSSSKRTKHIHMQYYFINNRWNKGEIDIQYCPTEDMIADVLTKPLQGKKFLRFRNKMLGIGDK